MNDSTPAGDTKSGSPNKKLQRPWWVSLLVVVAIVGYLWVKPKIEQRWGIELPGGDSTAAEQPSTDDNSSTSTTPTINIPVQDDREVSKPATVGSETKVSKVEKNPTSSVNKTESRPKRQAQQKPKNLDSKKSEPVLGQLKKVDKNVLESTAGLRYGPGSREGHRLKHVMLHASDQPNRSGKHGVFDGDQEEILALLDEVYLTAQKRGPPKNVRVKQDRNRTVMTVNLNRRVGFMGGQVGKSRGRPGLKKVRIVLEGKSVITAFPTD